MAGELISLAFMIMCHGHSPTSPSVVSRGSAVCIVTDHTQSCRVRTAPSSFLHDVPGLWDSSAGR
jgi:hypothetical protein